MRRFEARIERLEHRAVMTPSVITSEWLMRQPLSRMKQIVESLPLADLERLIAEAEGMKDA
jgi:hypothetical protein